MSEITLTRWRSRVDPRGTRLHTTWEEWFAELSKPARLGLAWDEKEQRDLPDKQRLSGWSAATFTGDHRTKDACESLCALVLEVDKGATLDAGIKLFSQFSGFLHTSPRHFFDPGNERYRIILPTNRLVTPAEYPRLWQWAHTLAKTAGIQLDPAPKDVSRLWYLPGTVAGAPFMVRRFEGTTVNVDAALDESSTRRATSSKSKAAPKHEHAVEAKTPSRHEALRNLACQRRARGGGRDEILEALREMNAGFDEPKVDEELVKIVEWVVQHLEPDNRPSILVDTHEGRMADETIAALETSNEIYQRSGMLVRVITVAYEKGGIKFEKDSPRIAPMPPSLLRELCSRSARYYSIKRDKKTGELIECNEHPPVYTVEQVLTRGMWSRIRPLTGVVEYPVLRPDGSVLQTPGYDEATGLLYMPAAHFDVVPDQPTHADAKSSAETLLELVKEFPFVVETHRSGWLAGLLTQFSRFSFEGCTPLFLIDAGAAGSGKSLLAGLFSAISTGRDMPRMAATEDENEMRKRLLTLAISGARMVLMDNVTGRLGGASLNMVLTSTVIEDRILGRNELCTVPWSTIVYATANNAQVADDTHRRTIYQRIEAATERPEDREGFEVPRLLVYAKKHRTRFVHAALTILRAYAVHLEKGGKPPKMRNMGSFEEWSDAVRAPLIWIGQPDPYLATVEWRDQNDTSAQVTSALLRGWKDLCDTVGKDALTAARALQHLASNDAAREAWRRTPERDRREPEPELRWEALRSAIEALKGGRALPASQQLGDLLRAAKGRVVDGQRLESAGKEHNVALWKVAVLLTKAQGGLGAKGGLFNINAGEKISMQPDPEPEERKIVGRMDGPKAPFGPQAPPDKNDQSAPAAHAPGHTVEPETLLDSVGAARGPGLCARQHWPPNGGCAECSAAWSFNDDGVVTGPLA